MYGKEYVPATAACIALAVVAVVVVLGVAVVVAAAPAAETAQTVRRAYRTRDRILFLRRAPCRSFDKNVPLCSSPLLILFLSSRIRAVSAAVLKGLVIVDGNRIGATAFTEFDMNTHTV